MKLKKNVISREEAIKISDDYVKFAEGDHDTFDIIDKAFSDLKVGQKVLTYIDKIFVLCKVSSINSDDYRAIDGPVVRVSNGEYSWRVDGDRYAYPVKIKHINIPQN